MEHLRLSFVACALAWTGCGDNIDPVALCDGVVDDGELCDDGDANGYDGCDCGARLIPPAAPAATVGAPVVLAEDGAWCWFQDERAVIVDDQLIVASIGHGGDIRSRRSISRRASAARWCCTAGWSATTTTSRA